MRASAVALALVVGALAGCTGTDPHAGTLGGNATSGSTTPTTPTVSTVSSPPPQVHWHASYQFWVESPSGTDERVSIVTQDGRFYFDNNRNARYLPAHVHACNPDLIHNEDRAGQGKLVDLFNSDWATLGAHLSSTEVVIPRGASFAGDYQADATHTVKLFVSHDNGTWAQQDVAKYALQNHDRILLMYGDQSADDISAKEAAFPLFESRIIC